EEIPRHPIRDMVPKDDPLNHGMSEVVSRVDAGLRYLVLEILRRHEIVRRVRYTAGHYQLNTWSAEEVLQCRGDRTSSAGMCGRIFGMSWRRRKWCPCRVG